ncbi:MAG: TlpA disulfide reductase family protein [Gemmatimonadaceae bacterium]
MTRRLLLAAIAVASCTTADIRPLADVGATAPDYAAIRLSGDSASLQNLRGKVVLLNVWATWCHPCRDEIPYLQQLYTQHAAEGFEVIGVSVDARGSEAAVAAFRDEFGMTYPIWLDPDERVQSLYMAMGVPASYLIDRKGVMRWKHLGTMRASDTTFTKALAASLASN